MFYFKLLQTGKGIKFNQGDAFASKSVPLEFELTVGSFRSEFFFLLTTELVF
jgi:hypothetical protein